MPLLQFQDFPLWLNLAIFAVGAGLVWMVGTRLSIYADLIAERTGLGKAFIGMVLLAGVTSLPEIATTATASLAGNPTLAANNLFGGVAMQTAILVLADAALRDRALTYFAPRPVLLLQGVFLVILLAVVLAGIAIGSPIVLFGLGIWSWLVLGLYLLSLYLLRRYEGRGRWQPVDLPDELHGEGEAEQTRPEKYDDQSTGQVLLRFAIGALLLLGAGFIVTRVAEALAGQTGLGTSFVGATLLAGVTSLPEVSTTISAVRLGAYSMAIANIFGSNALMVALVFLADVLYLEGPILQAVDRSSMFAALAGIVLTCVYLLGLIERRDKVVWRVGLDSAAVAMLYVGTLVVLYLSR